MTSLPSNTYVKTDNNISSTVNQEPTFNRVALFTTDVPLNAFTNGYKEYASAVAVETDFGSASETSVLANAMFNQEPSLADAQGVLVIVLLPATSATSGNTKTANIYANQATLSAEDNCSIAIDLNGTPVQVNGLNLTNLGTGATFWQNLVALLSSQPAFSDITISLISTSTTSYVLSFTSKTVGTTSTISLVAATSLPSGAVDLYGATFLNGVAQTSVGGVASSGTTLVQSMTQYINAIKCSAFFTNLQQEDSYILANGAYAQTNSLIYMQAISAQSQLALGGLANSNFTASQHFCRLLYYSNSSTANQFTAAYLGWFYSTKPLQGKITVSQKTLNGIAQDPLFGVNVENQCQAYGVDGYGTVSSNGIFSSNWGGTGWQFNIIYNATYIAYKLQIVFTNATSANNGGIPNNPDGISRLGTTLTAQMVIFRDAGFIEKNIAFTGTPPFGTNSARFKKNYLNQGFVVGLGNLANQNQALRVTRNAQILQVAYQLAGAIEGLTINLFARQ